MRVLTHYINIREFLYRHRHELTEGEAIELVGGIPKHLLLLESFEDGMLKIKEILKDGLEKVK